MTAPVNPHTAAVGAADAAAAEVYAQVEAADGAEVPGLRADLDAARARWVSALGDALAWEQETEDLQAE